MALAPFDFALDGFADHVEARFFVGQHGVDPRRCSFGKGKPELF